MQILSPLHFCSAKLLLSIPVGDMVGNAVGEPGKQKPMKTRSYKTIFINI